MVLRKKNKKRKKRNDAGVKRGNYKLILPDMYRSFLMRANSKGLEFSLTVEQFKKLIKCPCNYCGGKEKMMIERIDLEEGYTKENSQPCCIDCSSMRGDMENEEFISRIKKIYNNLFR